MKLDVYKGFDIEFYSKLEGLPLIEKDILDRLDVRKFDKKYSDDLQIAIIQKEGSYWATYEEYAFIKGFIEQRSLNSELEVNIIRNNLYPEIYPISYVISNDIIDEIEENSENKSTEELSEIATKITKIYSNLIEIDGENFVTYYNDEIGNDAINSVKEYYHDSLSIGSMQDNADFIINITNELEDFVKNVNEINKYGFKKIGLEMSCDTLTSQLIRKTYCTYFAFYNKDVVLFDYSEKIREKDKIIERFKQIAKDVIKIPNFTDFREIDFYENIDASRDTIKIL